MSKRIKKTKRLDLNLSNSLINETSISPFFTPNMFNGLVGWFEYNKGIVTSGSNVTRWENLADPSFPAIQNTVGNQPTVDTDFSIKFNGTSQWLEIADDARFKAGTGITVFAVYKSNNIQTARAVMGRWDGVTANRGDWILAANGLTGNSKGSFILANTAGSTLEGTTSLDCSDSNFHIQEGYWKTGEAIQSGRDGIYGTSSSTLVTANNGGISSIPTHIGKYAISGSVNEGFLDGSIKAILIYTEALTLEQRERVRNYLKRTFFNVTTPFQPGLVGWFEADNVTLDLNNKITQWNDMSGLGNHATQTTDDKKPWIITDSGYPAVEIVNPGGSNPSGTYLNISGSAFNLQKGFTIYAVIKSTDSAGGSYDGVVGQWHTSSANQAWALCGNTLSSSNGCMTVIETGTNTARESTITSDVTNGSKNILIGRVSCTSTTTNAGQVIGSLNTTSYTATAHAGPKGTLSVSPISIGRYHDINNVTGLAGYYYAILMFTSYIAHDSSEDIAIRTYLKNKWGTI